MKIPSTRLLHRSLFTGALFIFALARPPGAQANTITAVDITFHPGANLFGNPLNVGTNDLNHLFVTAPEGTTVSLWNTAAQQFSQTSLFTSGAWTLNLALEPGTGALLTTPSSFTVHIGGEVLNASGEPIASVGDGFDIMPPSAFGGPNGVYLFSSKLPVALPFTSGVNDLPPNTSFDAFDLIIGRAPYLGESVTRLDAPSQIYSTTTFDGFNWNNGAPGLGVGEGAFFTIVPEPSTPALGLSAVTLAALGALKRRALR